MTDAWLSEHETVMADAKKAYDDHIQELSHQGIGAALLTMMGKPFVEPEFRALDRDDLVNADAAVYVLARNSGEGADRKNIPGDYQLTENEKKDIALLAQNYGRFVLLLNVGGTTASMTFLISAQYRTSLSSSASHVPRHTVWRRRAASPASTSAGAW